MFYLDQMQAALGERNLTIEMSAKVIFGSILVNVLLGVTLVFFYAAVRPRFGPGPQTAVLVAVALFIGSYLISLLSYQMLGLFPSRLVVILGVVGLLAMVLATLVGGWIYSEA